MSRASPELISLSDELTLTARGSEIPCAPHNVSCRVRVASLDPFDEELFAFVKGSGTVVSGEVLDAQPRTVGREAGNDGLDEGGPESTTAVDRIDIELAKHVIRTVVPRCATPITPAEVSATITSAPATAL